MSSESPASDGVTTGSCAWEKPTAFELSWNAREVRLSVGRATVRRAGGWQIGNAIHLRAIGSARLTLSRVGDAWDRRVLSGDRSSDRTAELWISGAHLSGGWTISGTIERRDPGPDDAIVVTVGQDPSAPAPPPRPLTFTGGISGPHPPFADGKVGLPPSDFRTPVAPRAPGDQRTWTGAQSALWSLAGNWSPAAAPTTGEVLVFGQAGQNRKTMTNDRPGLVLGGVTVQQDGYVVLGEGLTLAPGSTSNFGGRFEIPSLAGAGSVTFGNELHIVQAHSTTFSGTFSSGGRLFLENGSGTFTYTGAGRVNTTLRSGGLVLDGGVLGETFVDGGQFGATGADGGTISGNFTANSGVYVQSIRSLTDFHQLSVNGSVTLNSRLHIVIEGSYTPQVGDEFLIIDNDGSDTVNNLFGFQNGDTVQTTPPSDVEFQIFRTGGDGNDVVLRVVRGGPTTSPNLEVVKSNTPPVFTAGGEGTYTIVVRNTGSASTTGVVTVVDTLPAGFTVNPGGVSGSGWNCSATASTVACTRQDVLAANTSYPNIVLTVLVAGDATTGTNVVTVSGGGDPNGDEFRLATPVEPPAGTVDLTIAKAATPASFEQGGEGTYVITVRNAGDRASSGEIRVIDTLPTGVSGRGPLPAGCSGTGTITCIRQDALAPGASFEIRLDVAIAADAPAFVTNTVTVSGGNDVNETNNSTSVETPVGRVAPELTGSKARAAFTPGETGTVSLTVRNAGNGPTSGTVTVIDTFPPGFTPIAGADNGWTCTVTGQAATCATSAAIAAGASSTFTIGVTVATDAQSSTNRASVSGGGDESPFDFQAPLSVVRTATDLTIAKTHTEPVSQGGTVAFQIVVSNDGQTASTGEVTVVDTLPPGLTLVGLAGPNWSCQASSLTCRRSDSLAGSASFEPITLTATIGLDVETAVNTVTVSGGGDLSPDNNTATDTVSPGVVRPDLTIEKSNSGPFVPGQTDARFTLTVRNVGARPTIGEVTVIDTVPPGLVPTAASGTGWACGIADRTVRCTRADALANGSAYPAIGILNTVDANATSDTNTAVVSGGGDVSPGNNTAQSPYTVTPPAPRPSLTLQKSQIGGSFVQGGVGSFTLVVGNAGPGATSGPVVLTDSLPAGLTPTAASGDGWSCAIQAQLLTCTREASIAAQAQAPPITLAVSVSRDATTVTNVATVTGGGDPDGATDSETAEIIGAGQLTITKSHVGPVLQGQQGLQFVLTVINNGTGPTIGQVTVDDPVPAGLVPVDATGAGWSCAISGQHVTCSRADALAAGASFPAIQLTVDVAPDATSVTNVATVGGGGDTTPEDNSAHDLVAIAPPGTANLVMNKRHDADFTQGQRGAVYWLRVDNRGTVASAGPVTVTDDVPAGLTPTGITGDGWTCRVAGQQAICAREDTLAAGASWPVIQLTVDVAPTAPNVVVNVATVSGGGDTTPADNTASDSTVVLPSDPAVTAPDLEIAKRHQDPFFGGQTGLYLITARNVGTGPTSGEVVVTDNVQAGMIPVSAAGSGWQCRIDGSVVTCRRSDVLAAGASYPEIALTVNVLPTATSAANVVTVSGGGDANESNNTGSDYTNVNGSVDATIDLSLRTPLVVGNYAELVAVARSLGPGTIGGETLITVYLPDELIPVTGIGSGWQCQVAGQELRCTKSGTFPPGTAYPELAITARVRAAADSVTIAAVVDAPGDVNEANDRAEITVASTLPSVELRITKTASTDRVVIGGAVTYRVEVANIGTARITGAVLRDLLPRGFRFVESSTDLQSTTRSERNVRPDDNQGQLTWQLGTLSPGEVVRVLYRVIVGAEARTGPQDNRAVITGTGPRADDVVAGPAIATVDVMRDTFSLLQAVVGRVYEDVDGNGLFTSADRPISGARVITSTGQASITDPDGLYNIPSLGSGSVAVSLDRSTVPGQLTMSGDGPGERSWTRLLRTPVGGGTVLRQDFALAIAEGKTVDEPPAARATDAAEPPVPLDRDAGDLPPRREYQSREGGSILIALGEVSFGQAAPEFEVFGRTDDVWGYGSIFLATPVASEKNRLTLAYDSRRHLNGTATGDRLFELDPDDRLYPVFGDTSRRQEFATSNAKFFGRLERGESYVMYGDLLGDLPSSARDGGRWSSYQRHLTGAELRVANDRGDGLTVRAAQPTTAFARDVFSGSLLGLLSLRHGYVRPGTETVAVEIRDRRMPERLVSRDVLARAVDYELDPITGSIFLRRQIGGFDPSLNLVQLVATYEYESAGLENLISSGRGTWSLRGLRVGGTFFTEEGADNGRFNVAGLDVEQELPRGGRLRLELPYSHGSPAVSSSVDRQLTRRPGAADGFGLQFDLDQPFSFWNGRFKMNALGAERNFQNPFSSTITPGARVLSSGVELSPFSSSLIKIGTTGEDYETERTDADRRTLSASWSQTIARRLTLTGGYDQRWLDRDGAEIESGLATAAARLAIGDRFEASASREENVGADNDPTYPDQTMVGARFEVGDDTALFYTQRISDDPIVPIGDFTGTGLFALPTRGELAVGIESRVADTTSLTSRYQIEQGVNGPDAFAAIGAVTQLDLGRGFAGTFGGEHGKLVSGAGDDYTSGRVGLSYLGSNRYKASVRYEGRERDGYSGLLTTGLAARLIGGITGLFRADWMDAPAPERDADALSFLGALAIRPVTNDRAGLLFSYQYVDRDGAVPVYGSRAESLGWRQRLSTDGYLQPIRRLDLHGKFAWSETGTSTDPIVSTYLLQGRGQLAITRFVDMAIESRHIRQRFTDTARRGTAAEVGFWPMADLRAAIGYSFDDTRDPEGRDAEGRARGVYGTISTKLSRLFNLMGSTPPPAQSR